jgi:hypothetical protein
MIGVVAVEEVVATEVVVGRSSIKSVTCGPEPPWGVEPQTYALRVMERMTEGVSETDNAAHVRRNLDAVWNHGSGT